MGYEIGIPYTLTGPDGTIAVFNAQGANFVGYITDISGLDSALLRDNAEDVVEGDGGVHGDFYEGRRPIVIDFIIPEGTSAQRNAQMDRIERASNALRGDAVLTWQESGTAIVKALWLRKNGLRFTGGVSKSGQLSMVSADPRILSFAVASVSDPASPLSIPATNLGTKNAYPQLRVYGATTSPVTITNVATGRKVVLNYAIPGGKYVDIFTYPLGRNAVDSDGVRRYSKIDFALTNWPFLSPGAAETWTSDKGTRLDIFWRHAF